MSYNKSSKITASELVLSAIFFLQEKGGITVKDITKFICEKRGCKQSHVRHEVKKALEKATENGIFTKKRGLYKIESGFGKNKISVKINGRSRPKKAKKKDSAIRGASDLSTSPFNEEEYDNEYIPNMSETNYSAKKKAYSPDINMGDPIVFNSSKGNRVSIERLKQAIMGDEDDDDEDFFEEDEAEEDEDMDFFSDEENINHCEYLKPEKADFVQEEPRESEPEKKKAKIVKKCTKYKSKSKNRNKSKKRKASKPRKKSNKRKRGANYRLQRKTEKDQNSEVSGEKNPDVDKGNKEKNAKKEAEETQPDVTDGYTPNLMDDFLELYEEDMTEEEPNELNSVLYSRNGEGYESEGYLSPNEEILLENLISRDGTLIEKSENSQHSQKSNAEGSTSENVPMGEYNETNYL